MSASSSLKLLNTMEWAKKLNFDRSMALSNSLEPAVTSANTVLQTIVGAPFAWPWNRAVTGFIAAPGQQDYILFNWSASVFVAIGTQTVDPSGNSQIVTTAGITGTLAPLWNTTKGGLTNDGLVAVWTNQGSIGTPVSSTYNLAWIETASVRDLNDTKWYQMQTEICLGLDSSRARPRNVSAQGDDGQGNVTFRLMPIPDQAYPVAISMQQKPPLFTSVNQPWAPVPDSYSHIYNWGFLSLMWMYADDARYTIANQKFVTQLLGANRGLTDTQINIFLNNWQALSGQPIANQTAVQQGFQSRGV